MQAPRDTNYIPVIMGVSSTDLSTPVAIATNPSTGAIKAEVVLSPLTINTQTDDYTLVLADASAFINMNKATANTLTIPTNASVAFPVGTRIAIRQMGAGQTTIAPAGGVTMNSQGAATKCVGQYAIACLFKVATDTWSLEGNITT